MTPTEQQRRLRQAIAETTQPGSGIAMCHRQGKTAVYLSDDGRYIVEHPPHGPIIRISLEEVDAQSGRGG